MWAGRIAVVIVLFLSAFCFTLAGVVAVNLPRIESPERYLAIGLGLVMLYMGGSMLAGVIWPTKPKDPNAPIEVPPLHEVRGRTRYRDGSLMARNTMLAIGVIFLAASLGAAPEQPIVLVIAIISVGVIAGAGVMTLRQFQYGRARLELANPARRGDVMRGTITVSGSAWTMADHDIGEIVDVVVSQIFQRSRGGSSSTEIERAMADTSVVRDGRDLTIRFTATIPLIDTSDGKFSWSVELETDAPQYRTSFLIDVA